MRKVIANLVFSHGYDNETGKTYYKVRMFYVVTRDYRIIPLINYGHSSALAYKYDSMKSLLESMHKVLKSNHFKTDNVNIGSFTFDGIMCTEIDEECYITSPTRFSVK